MNNYTTRDLYLAAYLITEGLPLAEVERRERVCYFHFEDLFKAEKFALDYRKNQANCRVREYVDALHELKGKIFEGEYR